MGTAWQDPSSSPGSDFLTLFMSQCQGFSGPFLPIITDHHLVPVHPSDFCSVEASASCPRGCPEHDISCYYTIIDKHPSSQLSSHLD